MHDLGRGAWARPSQIAGWGMVVVVHVFMWQVLNHGLDVASFVPALKAVQVKIYERVQPPPVAPPPPRTPTLELPTFRNLYVPAPEIDVVHESAAQVTAVSIRPVDERVSTPVASAPMQSDSVPVVSDSEVDYVVRPKIRYPLAAKRAREQGTVLLSVIVDEHGLVRRIKVHRSSGYQRLDEVALRALRSLRVKPYMRNGVPLAVEIRVPVEFSLSNAA